MCALIDTTGDQAQSSITSIETLTALVETGLLAGPFPMSTQLPGEDPILFDLPAQVAAP